MKVKALTRRTFMAESLAASILMAAGCSPETNEQTVTTKGNNMDFKDLIQMRRSVRRYAPCTITAEELGAIVTDALEAPSWKNTEPTRYYASVSPEMIARLRAEALPPFNAANSENAAALVTVTYKRGLSGFSGDQPSNELGDVWGAYDAGLANAYFLLAAKNRGWDTLVMGIRDEAKLREILSVPADETILAVIAVGKAAVPPRKVPRKAVAEVLKIS